MNILKFLFVLTLLISSCHKTVTPRKLDGDWTVTSYIQTELHYSPNWTDITTVNDGVTTTMTQGSTVDSYPSTTTYSFDKKKGTYVKVHVIVEEVDDSKDSYTLVNGVESNHITYEQQDTKTTTTTTTGTFSITGGTGEIEKNTQIVLNEKTITTSINHVYIYSTFNGVITDFTNKYILFYATFGNMNGQYEPMAATKLETMVNSGELGESLFTVTKLKKGVMEMESNYSSNVTAELGASSFSNNLQIVLTQKK